MLRNGQKVQVANDSYITEDGKEQQAKVVGKITTITEFVGSHISPSTGNMEDYYGIACTDRTIARACLLPIDDEPCEEEFLEQFNQLIKEKVN